MPRAGIFGKSDVIADAAADSLRSVETSADRGSEIKPGGVAKILSTAPGRVEVVVTSAEGGLLVLHDIDYPGWFAEVDGKPTPILARRHPVPRGGDTAWNASGQLPLRSLLVGQSWRRVECRAPANDAWTLMAA